MNVKLRLFLMQKPGTIILFSNQYSQETQIQTQIDDEHQAIFDAYKNGDIEKAAQMMKIIWTTRSFLIPIFATSRQTRSS